MNHEQAYALSAFLSECFKANRDPKMQDFNCYRYRYFVDNSPRRQHCKYAQMSLKAIPAELPDLKTYLETKFVIPVYIKEIL
jgi:hypothetical protein